LASYSKATTELSPARKWRSVEARRPAGVTGQVPNGVVPNGVLPIDISIP
jgi:hypothetical protein